MPHHEHLQYLVQGHPRGVELNLFRVRQDHDWQYRYGYPETGLALHYLYFANPVHLGSGWSLYPYADFPLVEKRLAGLRLRTGASAGYISKPFDPATNFKNNAIASHLNCFINIRLNAYLKLSRSFRMDYGLGLSHFSNGAFRTPNLGINTLEFTLGLSRISHIGTPVPMYPDIDTGNCKRLEWVVIAGGSRAEVQPPSRTGYAAFTVSAAANWVRSQKSRWVLGIESGYHGGNRKRIATEDPASLSYYDLTTIGLKAGYAQRIGKLELPFEFGTYLHSKVADNGPFFQRIGMRYYIYRQWVVNLTLKTHWAVADHWEFGAGYIFGKK